MAKATTEKPLVLLTGAAGNIGRRLGRELSRSCRVVGYDLDASADTGFPMIEADLTDEASLREAAAKLAEDHGDRIASVIHLAAYFDFTGERVPAYDEVNVKGTRRLIDSLKALQVEQFVYSGTMLVHRAGRPGEVIDENTPIDPGWAYPESKAETEEVIEERLDGPRRVFLHLAGLYDDESAVPTLAHQISRIYERRLKSHLYSGDLAAGQAFIHFDDLARLVEAVIDRREALPHDVTILGGEPHAVGFGALQDQLGQVIHDEPRWPTLRVPTAVAKLAAWIETKSEPVVPDAYDRGEKPFVRAFMAEMASDHYALDISRAQELLDWTPKHRIDHVLPRIVEKLKADPVEWYADHGITPPTWMISAAERGADVEGLRQRHEAEFRESYRGALWAHWINAGLGIWVMTSPPMLGYVDNWMRASDLVTGFVLFAASMLALSWRLSPARWVAAAAGVWLMFAPLLFWSEVGTGYLNGTLVGMIAAALALAVGPPPGVSPTAATTGPTIPKGWAYSPSEWFQRIPVVILALVGLLISRYLAAYQLETIPGVWDPLFDGTVPGKNGSEDIVTSSVSRAWPVPDAGIGGLTYALEIVVGLIGGTARWRTMPWLVVLFGIMIVPLGAVSIFFIVIQPILIGTYCTLCLIAAAAMLFQIPYSLDEMVATYQFLRRRHRAGRPWLRVFFSGDTDEGPDEEVRENFSVSPKEAVKDMLTGGMTLPWNLAATLVLGLLLMLAPLVIGWDDGMAGVFHVVGALALTVGVTALAPVARAARFMNLLLAVVLVFAPFLVETGWLTTLASVVFALGLGALSIPRGEVNQSFGSWDRYVV